jgi:hypothetical protein
MRRLLSTGAVVFSAPGTAAQAAVACLFAMFSIVVALYCQPHAERVDGQIYTIGTVIIFLSMFFLLAMRTIISNETYYSQNVFAAVLVAPNVVMVIAAVVQMALVSRRASESRQNSVLGLAKIGHINDKDNDESAVFDTEPAAPSAAATTTNKFETVEQGIIPVKSEQDVRQSDMRF